MSDSLNAHEPSAAAKRLQVAAALDDANVSGDARLIHRLVPNLVVNAIRYNITGGGVEIELAATATETTLTVTNTGPPVPPDQVGRLLEPFQRAARTGPSAQTGSVSACPSSLTSPKPTERASRSVPDPKAA